MPNKERKNNRWLGYDYSLNASYFVTICVKDKQNYFGQIRDGVMYLNQAGQIIRQGWLDLPNHYWNCGLDMFIIMPDHVHGIIILDDSNIVGNGLKPFHTDQNTAGNGFKPNNSEQNAIGNGLKPFPTTTKKPYNLSEIVRGFKTFSSRRIHGAALLNNFCWQKSFYDHVVRSNEYLDKIRLYIQNNPMKWAEKNDNLDHEIIFHSKSI